MDKMNTLGERLREERERLGLSQTEMAELGGVQRNAQSKYERGERSPDVEYLSAVAEKGVDVLYVITGTRSPTPFTLTEPQKQVLRRRGIRIGTGQLQAEIEISPLGLMWLLNMRQSMGTGEPMHWGEALLGRLAEFEPVHMRGLNLQAVRLPTYNGNEYPYLIMYLDKTPPAIPWGMTPQAGLKERYELDLNEHSLPLTFPDDGYLPPVFCLSEDDLAALKNGRPVRYEAGALKG